MVFPDERFPRNPRSTIITVNLPWKQVDALAALQSAGTYPSRSEAIRTAIRDVFLMGDEAMAKLMAEAPQGLNGRASICTLNLPAAYIDAMRELQYQGIARSRSDFIRIAVERFIQTEATLAARHAVLTKHDDPVVKAIKGLRDGALDLKPKRELDMRSFRGGWGPRQKPEAEHR